MSYTRAPDTALIEEWAIDNNLLTPQRRRIPRVTTRSFSLGNRTVRSAVNLPSPIDEHLTDHRGTKQASKHEANRTLHSEVPLKSLIFGGTT